MTTVAVTTVAGQIGKGGLFIRLPTLLFRSLASSCQYVYENLGKGICWFDRGIFTVIMYVEPQPKNGLC